MVMIFALDYCIPPAKLFYVGAGPRLALVSPGKTGSVERAAATVVGPYTLLGTEREVVCRESLHRQQRYFVLSWSERMVDGESLAAYANDGLALLHFRICI